MTAGDVPVSGGHAGGVHAGGDRRGTLLATAAIGIGLMAALDEIVFHQLLGWHHFYDRSTLRVGLVADGLLHATEVVLLVVGFFWFAGLRRRGAMLVPWAWAGLFVGLGGFQLFDGLVNHKVLRLHQIRYGVDPLPYDVAWNLGAVALLAIGGTLAWRARRPGRPPESSRSG